jgi:hypothetical protein
VPLALSVEAKPFGAANKAIRRNRLIWSTRSHHIFRYVQKAGEDAALLPKPKQVSALPGLAHPNQAICLPALGQRDV